MITIDFGWMIGFVLLAVVTGTAIVIARQASNSVRQYREDQNRDAS